MPRFSTVLTDRLLLTPPRPVDVDPMFALNSDPRLWTHLPSGRHRERTETDAVIEGCRDGWESNGLDYWVIRLREDESTVVGMGGCSRRGDHGWNLYYRLHPATWGRGLAQELISAATAAARQTSADLPVVAYLLEHNLASKRAAERAGLQLRWRGRDAGNADPDAIRLIYADRNLDREALECFSK